MIETALRHALMSALAFGWPWTTPSRLRPSALVSLGVVFVKIPAQNRRQRPAVAEPSMASDNADDNGRGPVVGRKKLNHLPRPRTRA